MALPGIQVSAICSAVVEGMCKRYVHFLSRAESRYLSAEMKCFFEKLRVLAGIFGIRDIATCVQSVEKLIVFFLTEGN